MPNRRQPLVLQTVFLAAAAVWLANNPRRPRRPLLWSAICFAADLMAIPAILRAKPEITASEMQELQPEHISRIDRIALGLPVERQEHFQKISDRILQASAGIPLIVFFQQRSRENRLQDYIWGHALTYTLYSFGPFAPAFVDKFRPVVYRSELTVGERANGNNRNSQYSGHTGNAAFAGVFFAGYLWERHDLPKAALLMIAAAPGLLVGFLRVRAQKHFPSDVLLAALIGAAIAMVFTRPIGNRRVI